MDFDVRLLAPIATAIGVVVSIILWTLSQRRKALKFQVLRREALVNLRGKTKKRLDVRFDGQPVHDAHLVVVRVVNTGHLPIAPGDYQSEPAICVSGGSTILTADVTETNPVDLEERCKGKASGLIEGVQRDRVVLSSILLNSGDSLTVQMLVRHLSGRISMSGHIHGINELKEMQHRPILPTLLTQVGALIMASAMLMVDPSRLVPFEIEDVMPCIFVFSTGYVLLAFGLYLPKRHDSLVDWEV